VTRFTLTCAFMLFWVYGLIIPLVDPKWRTGLCALAGIASSTLAERWAR
jgi:hypothetical protein